MKPTKAQSFRYSFGIAAVLILLIFLHYTKFLEPIENIFIRVLSPIHSLVYSGASALTEVEFSKKSYEELVEENEELKKQISELQVSYQQLQNKVLDQESLLAQYGYLEQREVESVTARVIGKDPFSQSPILIIDKGSKSGIQKEFPVIIQDGILVGKIIEVQPNLSKIILSTDQRIQIASTFQNDESTTGVVTGEHALTMKMELIPKDILVEEGDIIITSGQQEFIPRGLIVGQVQRVEKETNGFFQTAFIQSLVHIDSQRVVSVLLP